MWNKRKLIVEINAKEFYTVNLFNAAKSSRQNKAFG
jgi:hypothetical protein